MIFFDVYKADKDSFPLYKRYLSETEAVEAAKVLSKTLGSVAVYRVEETEIDFKNC